VPVVAALQDWQEAVVLEVSEQELFMPHKIHNTQ
jgi:hypothetical protein